MPILIALIFLILIAILIFWTNSDIEEFNFPRNGEAKRIKVIAKDEYEDVQTDIFETEGIRHLVPFCELIDGHGKDKIPSIDNPKFISGKDADAYLSESDPGIVLSVEGITRFYPFQILVWHEAVNDIINGKRILITYCPLCFCGMVFDPFVNGERTDFGTSGKLWNSNLVMYDRLSGSLWSQITGKSLAGMMAGAKLKRIPSEQTCYGTFKKKYPGGETLSRDTGFLRFYGEDPYSDYYIDGQIFFPVAREDGRLCRKDFIFGIFVNKKPKAYWIGALQKSGEDFFHGKKIVWKHSDFTGSVSMFEDENGQLKKIYPVPSFWFAWAAIYPETEVYK